MTKTKPQTTKGLLKAGDKLRLYAARQESGTGRCGHVKSCHNTRDGGGIAQERKESLSVDADKPTIEDIVESVALM